MLPSLMKATASIPPVHQERAPAEVLILCWFQIDPTPGVSCQHLYLRTTPRYPREIPGHVVTLLKPSATMLRERSN